MLTDIFNVTFQFKTHQVKTETEAHSRTIQGKEEGRHEENQGA